MFSNIFVNLPIKSLARSRAFFEHLGLKFNPQFSNENTGCLVLGPNLFAMLLEAEPFKGFIPGKEIADAHKTTEVLVAVSVDSREQVAELAAKAVEAGGTRYRDRNDMGFMVQEAFQDLDGHIWEVVWMDPGFVQ
jgi:uncharacterized protein